MLWGASGPRTKTLSISPTASRGPEVVFGRPAQAAQGHGVDVGAGVVSPWIPQWLSRSADYLLMVEPSSRPYTVFLLAKKSV